MWQTGPDAVVGTLSKMILPERTILLHLPNCFAFPLLLLAGAASLCTMSPISTLLTPEELANILAKARPGLVVTSKLEGEEKLQSALQILLERPDGTNTGAVPVREVKSWARGLLSSWEETASTKQRVWTVDMNRHGGADYYVRDDKCDRVDARDWTHLLGPKRQEAAFVVRDLTEQEQRRRVILLLWSSGTTGASKGVLLSHRNLVASMVGNWVSCPHIFGPSQGPLGGGERWIALAPWCHIYG
jgi:4-coumarate--CoA ligase